MTALCVFYIITGFCIGAPLLCAILAAMEKTGFLDGGRR